jgi:hypothetical protein
MPDIAGGGHTLLPPKQLGKQMSAPLSPDVPSLGEPGISSYLQDFFGCKHWFELTELASLDLGRCLRADRVPGCGWQPWRSRG